MSLKLLIALVCCIAVYLNVWRVGSETVVQRASRDLRRGNREARRAAVTALADSIIQVGASAVPPLAWALVHDADSEVRFTAAAALGEYGGPHEEAAAALFRALKQDSPRIRARSAQSLAAMAELPSVTPALIAALGDTSSEVRAAAAAALGRSTQDWEAVEPALFATRADAEPSVRLEAIVAMDSRSAGPRSTSAAPPARVVRYQAMMLAGLRDDTPRVRRAAARALGREPSFGFGDPVALTNAEIAALSDADSEVRASAANALDVPRIGLSPPIEPVRRAMARALVRLIDSLGDTDDRVRVAALRSIGPVSGNVCLVSDDEALDLRSALIAVLDNPKPEARAAAVAISRRLVQVSGEGDDFLTRRFAIGIADPDPRVRMAVVVAESGALAAVEYRRHDADRWLAELVSRLSRLAHLDISVLRYSPSLGSVARHQWVYRVSFDHAAIERMDKFLRPMIDDPDPDVRRVAFTVLRRIDVLLMDSSDERRRLLTRAMKSQMAALASQSPRLREMAAWSLYWVPEADAPAVVAALRSRLDDDDLGVRNRVLESLKGPLYPRGDPPRHPWPAPSWPPWSGVSR